MRFMSVTKTSYRLRFVASILTFLFTANASSEIAQKVVKTSSTGQSSLRNFLIQYLGTPDSEEDRTDTRYLSATIDLDGDGQPETIVYILSSEWCGSGGCPMLILTTQNAHYRVITRTTIHDFPFAS